METYGFAEVCILLILLLGSIGFYLLPALLANNPKSAGAIFWVNLLFGWTGLIWLVCLIWAITTRNK